MLKTKNWMNKTDYKAKYHVLSSEDGDIESWYITKDNVNETYQKTSEPLGKTTWVNDDYRDHQKELIEERQRRIEDNECGILRKILKR